MDKNLKFINNHGAPSFNKEDITWEPKDRGFSDHHAFTVENAHLLYKEKNKDLSLMKKPWEKVLNLSYSNWTGKVDLVQLFTVITGVYLLLSLIITVVLAIASEQIPSAGVDQSSALPLACIISPIFIMISAAVYYIPTRAERMEVAQDIKISMFSDEVCERNDEQFDALLAEVLSAAHERLDSVGEKTYNSYTKFIDEKISIARALMDEKDNERMEMKRSVDEEMSEMVERRFSI